MTTPPQLSISDANDTQFLPIPYDPVFLVKNGLGFALTAGSENSGTIITVRLDLQPNGIDIKMILPTKRFNCTADTIWEHLSVTFAINFTSDEGEALK